MPRFMDNEDGTPCPVRSISGSNSSNPFPAERPSTSFPLAAFGDDDDDLDDLEFTREILPEAQMFKPAAPPRRRGQALKEPPRRITAHVPPPPKIQAQPKPKPQQQQQQRQRSSGNQETKPFVGDAEAIAAGLEPERRPQRLQRQPRRSLTRNAIAAAARRRVSAMLKARAAQRSLAPPDVPSTEPDQQHNVSSGPTKGENDGDDRRKMLVDKTTNSHTISNGPHHNVSADMEKKWLKAPPKRAPLQPAAKPPLHREGTADMVRERASGKENIPPNGQGVKRKVLQPHSKAEKARVDNGIARSKQGTSEVLKPLSKKRSIEPSRKRSNESAQNDDEESFTSRASTYSEYSKRDSGDSLRLVKRQKTSIGSLPSPPSLSREEEASLLPAEVEGLLPAPLNFRHPQEQKFSRQLDPLLKDDLVRCEMYEESWLSAQEASVSQLLNHLLIQYSPAPLGKDRVSLRRELLGLYSSPPFPLIYNRVHASLLYGALAVTQQLLEKSSTTKFGRAISGSSVGQQPGWGADVGLKQRFLDLFLETYDQTSLVTALEVVVGREMFAVPHPGQSERAVLKAYLERYTIRSEDLLVSTAQVASNSRNASKLSAHSSEDEDKGSSAWFLRRSLLRSFMLIILLDKAKARGFLGQQCLFKKPSVHKTSMSVLQALSRLLLPFIGDVSKPLSHLNYSLETTQQPLSEYDYKIDNLAIDLRDGIRLTRLVEVFLRNRNSSPALGFSPEANGTEEDWPLTPHLHYPVISRAQKLHNVNLALSALDSVGGNPQRLQAKDVVDGFREKTVGLLWSLVSRWGLDMLVDWTGVRKEIERLNLQSPPRTATEVKKSVVTPNDSHTDLLQSWARAVARKAGFTVDNLTTSFGDGRVFAAIVNEYEQYLPSSVKNDRNASLEAKLKGVGCNSYFAGLFNSEEKGGTVYTKDFVISGLAYLCSRILQPSIAERAAIVIQRVYRQHAFRHAVHKRINLLLLAHDCAQVVNTKKRIINAAVTIQRAFRTYLHLKIVKLVNAITGIQSAARGLIARRNLRQFQSAAKTIQRRWRDLREAQFHERMGIAKHAVMGFQANARGFLVRMRVWELQDSVATIQDQRVAVLLGRRARAVFLNMKAATTIIQRSWRLSIATREDRQKFTEARQSAKVLQAVVRGVLVRREHQKKVKAVVALQKWLRATGESRGVREEYCALRQAAIFVQQRRRRFVISRAIRRDFVLLSKSVAHIKERFLEKKRILNAATILQRAWRKRAWIVRMRKILAEVVRIESAWRGYMVRRDSGPRIRVIRKRLARIAESGVKEEDRLGNRTKRGLEMVRTKAGLARGVLQLEFVTRFSKECATVVVEDDDGFAAVLAYLDTTAAQMQKTSSSMAVRNFALAANIVRNISMAPAACSVLAKRTPTKCNKDIFAVLLVLIDVLKGAALGTLQSDLLAGFMEALRNFMAVEGTRSRLLARRKWVESAVAVLNEIKKGGAKKRGVVGDTPRMMAADSLLALLEA